MVNRTVALIIRKTCQLWWFNWLNYGTEILLLAAPRAVATCYILIVAVAALGNLIVCFAIIANKSLRSSPTNLFILSLAFSDLLTATLAVPFDIEGLFLNLTWKHGEIMCQVWVTVYLITVAWIVTRALKIPWIDFAASDLWHEREL